MENQRNWHLDKKVSIGIIVALALNASAGIYKAGSIEHKIDELDRRTRNNQQIIERLVKVETQVVAVKESLLRIEKNLLEAIRK